MGKNMSNKPEITFIVHMRSNDGSAGLPCIGVPI